MGVVDVVFTVLEVAELSHVEKNEINPFQKSQTIAINSPYHVTLIFIGKY